MIRAIVILLLQIFTFGWLDMLVDTVNMGLDYIDLHQNSELVTTYGIEKYYGDYADERGNVFVVATDDDFADLEAKLAAGDEQTLAWHDAVVRGGDDLLETPLVAYSATSSDDEFLEVSRTVVRRMIVLGYLWRVTGDARYASRAVAEIENVCAFPDWRTSQFLDVAEMSFAVSLGCNWLYDFITPQQKALAAKACYEKAMTPGSGSAIDNWWSWSKTNWNGVCHGAMGVTSMVFYEEYPDEAKDFLVNAYQKMPYGFENFTPDGVYVEGSGYWDYSADYLSWFISTSNNFFGVNFGLTEIPGLLEMGTFPLYIMGSTGPFNYGDNKNELIYSSSLYWFARQTGNGLLAEYQTAMINTVLSAGDSSTEFAQQVALSLLLDNGDYDEGGSLPLAVHLKSDNMQELAIFRSAYMNPYATYAAIKGGYNYTNHGDLDIGTFVYDWGGVRWAEDLGPTYYSTDDYFVGIIGGGRWKTYAKRAEGQNTMVFNPNSIFEDQYPFATAGFSSFEADEDNGGRAVLDMSAAYKYCGVKKAVREFCLSDNYNTLTITDTFECSMNSDAYWFMHTKADIEIVDSHTAILTIGSLQMKATLSADSVGSFVVMPLQSLVDGVDNTVRFGEGVSKLAVVAKGLKNGQIKVTLSPVIQP